MFLGVGVQMRDKASGENMAQLWGHRERVPKPSVLSRIIIVFYTSSTIRNMTRRLCFSCKFCDCVRFVGTTA